MPTFTIETTYRLPVYRQRVYEAPSLEAACARAVDDDGWEDGQHDVETSGPTYVTGIWAGHARAHKDKPLSVPAQFQADTDRMAAHFPTLLEKLEGLAAGRTVNASTYVAIVKGKAIAAGDPDPNALALTDTPWGRAEAICVHDAGIRFLETPSHGGFHLDAERNAEIPEPWRLADGWYEEDLQWAKVVVTFPEVFDDDRCTHAEGIVQRCFPLPPASAPDDHAMTLLRTIADEIDAFDAETEASQSTDTGIVWNTYFNVWRDKIRALLAQNTAAWREQRDAAMAAAIAESRPDPAPAWEAQP